VAQGLGIFRCGPSSRKWEAESKGDIESKVDCTADGRMTLLMLRVGLANYHDGLESERVLEKRQV
jgi:hypothetical protein